jgi:myo-inositol-1(or 4)-monophosphatase
MASKNRSGTRGSKRGAQAGIGTEELKRRLVECTLMGGDVLRRYFGKLIHPRQKEAPSSVVCDADLASEKRILDHLRAGYPDHNFIAEESGRIWRGSEYTWVIDPLDGTSNFVSGIPWFGVQIALLRGPDPILGAMYLPLEDALYFGQTGEGAYRNGKRVRVTAEPDLQKVLCAFGFDPAPERRSRRRVELLFRVSAAVRNTRATNSLVDFCYTVDGRFGGFVNLKTRIWDIAPVAVILPEAGGRFTHLDGRQFVFELGERATDRDYAVLGASAGLHAKLAALVGSERRSTLRGFTQT